MRPEIKAKKERRRQCLVELGGLIVFLSLCPYPEGSPALLQQWTITLNISPTAIFFPPADPDLQPVVEANAPLRVQITTWPPNRRWALYIRAEGDLINSEGKVISINTISWKASPNPPFLDGVLLASQNVLLAQERGNQEGEIFFYFQNSWDYQAGEYSQIVTFTASLI